MPAVDKEGKLLLETKSRVFVSPDGHGGARSQAGGAGATVNKAAMQGRPIFGVELRTVDLDDRTKVLPRDGESSGALQIRGPWVIRRYFKADEDAGTPSTPSK